jgi:YVTN family beta-propeller protein
VAVNPVTDQVYVANVGSNTVAVIDGATNTVTNTVSVGTTPDAVAVNPVTDKVYVANDSSNNVTAIDTEGIQPVPITTTVAGVSDSLTTSTANNVFQTMNTQPSFTVQATSAYSTSSAYSGVTATDPPPTELYDSVDGGPWSATPTTSTSGSNPASFSLALSRQSLGFHTLYYYVGYGNEGGQNSSLSGTGNSPEISNVEAYHFLVEPLSTTTSVVADVNPQNVGSNVTFTATVTPAATTSALTGTVQFYDGTTALGSPLTVQSSGGVYQAVYSTSSLAAGTHTINVIYSGDVNYGASSGSMTEQIAGAAATLAATSGVGQSAVIGTAFANPIVVTVLDSSGTPVPNATVTFSGTGLSFSPATVSTNSSGEASTTATPTQGGALTGTAAVTGATSAIFSETGLQLTATVQVAPASTVYGTANTTLMANVAYTGTTAPTGAVSFTVNGGASVTASCTGASSPLICTASYPTASLGVGGSPYTTNATLAADTDYDAVTASSTLVVNPAPLKVTANNATKAYGTANPTFTGTVTGMVNGNTFTESFTTEATATSSVGPYPIVPSVAGTDLSDYTVTTVDGTLVVSQAGSAVSLTSSTSNANLNANVTFTATVTSATTGTPTGSVEFLDGSTVLGTGPLNNQGVATYTTSTLTAGLHQITAVYQGDVNFTGSTSAALAQIVTAPDFSLMSNVNSLSLKAGQTGQVTISMIPVGGFTGTVQFTCSGLPSESRCTLSPPALYANGSNSTQSSTLTITTNGPNSGTVALMTHPGKPDGVMLAGIFWLPGLLFGGFLMWQRRKLTAKYRVLVLILLVATTLSGMVGCGFQQPMTGPGTKTVTVTATNGTITQTATIAVQITQ